MAWSCVTGEPAKDCIAVHWLPHLNGRPEPSGGRAPCPVREHKSDRPPLSIQAKNGRPVWNCHCGCTDETVGKAIAAVVTCYTWAPPRTKAQVALVREFGHQQAATDREASPRIRTLQQAGKSQRTD